MTVVKLTIQTQIKSMLQGFKDKTTAEEAETTMDEFADELSTIIQEAILSATITVPTGIPVATTGTAAAQTGATTSTAIATIA